MITDVSSGLGLESNKRVAEFTVKERSHPFCLEHRMIEVDTALGNSG
ncbi:MAG: hypothetical protein KME25_03310 [Symplocastrum torsivum CPER-KK1]|jgi:hypothetical protein|uniref:Uncharacterized protein n=1 Tax=Symplocastrum torsivum CPER-KK1 TaxID=450513 RepID=A0A951PI07_9CYAN|nr:hypothetical protein [Symplocastrum torsivum CPER-KK1]